MKNKTANPSPLGSLGFGMTTVLFSVVNAGFYSSNAMLLSMAIFLGGIGQIIAGILEYKRGNTFGFLSYTMFGLYWEVIVGINLLPVFGLSVAAESGFIGVFFLLWTVFSVMLLIQTFKMDKFTIFIFVTVVLLFGAITLRQLTGLDFFGKFSGWIGILCGGCAMASGYKALNNKNS